MLTDVKQEMVQVGSYLALNLLATIRSQSLIQLLASSIMQTPQSTSSLIVGKIRKMNSLLMMPKSLRFSVLEEPNSIAEPGLAHDHCRRIIFAC